MKDFIKRHEIKPGFMCQNEDLLYLILEVNNGAFFGFPECKYFYCRTGKFSKTHGNGPKNLLFRSSNIETFLEHINTTGNFEKGEVRITKQK